MKPRSFKWVRNAHRWSGVFFAPLVVLFALSGLLQVLQVGDLDLPEWLIRLYEAMEDAHQDQRFRRDTALRVAAQWLTVLMSLVLIVTTLLGVVMAWTMYPKRRWLLVTVLVIGTVVPVVLMVV